MDSKMKIKYLFCGAEVGELRKTEKNTYVYNSNAPNEQKLLCLSEAFEASGYSLRNSSNRESSFLFGEFKQLIETFSKKTLIRDMAKITKYDSNWDKLVKFARLKYFTPTFYVQLADDERN